MQRRRLRGVSRAGGRRPDRIAGTTLRIGVESLESRRLLAVSVTGSLPAVSASPGAPPAVVSTDGLFAVTGVGVQGTVVRMATQAGATSSYRDLFIELFDTATEGRSAAPVSTANFLRYVTSGRYDNSFFHRATDFAGDVGPARFLQGGGYVDRGPGAGSRVASVSPDEPIALEWAADRPNVAGTIAYARTSDPNSATGGFFFNVTANPMFDDPGVPGGATNRYAVFGRVLGDGQAILDEYAALERFDADGASDGPFGTLPLAGDASTNVFDRLVVVRSAGVVAAPQAAVGLRVESSAPEIVSARVNADGRIALDYGTQPGEAVVTVTGTDLSGDEAETTFTVSVAGSPTDGDVTRDVVLGGSGPTSLIATDADGTRSTYTWRGPGTATFRFGTADEPTVSGRRVTVPGQAALASIEFEGGTSSSSLVAVSSGGDGVVDVGRIDAVGAIGRLTLPRVRVGDGAGLADGVTAVVLAGVGGVVEIGGSRVGTVTLGEVADADVTLPSVATLKMTGVRDSSIALRSTGTILASAVERTTLAVEGSPRRIAFASLADSTVRIAETAGVLAVAGAVTGSRVEVGTGVNSVRVGTFVDSALLVGVAAGVDAPTEAADIEPTARLGTFAVTSRDADAFAGSQVAAGAIGTAQLGSLATGAGAQSFVVARTAAVVSGRGPSRPFTLRRVERVTDAAEQLAAAGVDAERLTITAFG